MNSKLTIICSVRTVSSNFGFAFGSFSAPNSSGATSTHEVQEPPSKRRKTILSNEVVAAGFTVLENVDAPKSKKNAKSRRKLDLECEDSPQTATVADDSFIATLGARKASIAKSKAKKTPVTKKPAVVRNKAKETPAKSTRPAVEILESQPATVSRPRRRAAATAASKVTEGFEGEAIRVDKKRRVPAANDKYGRLQQRDAVVEEQFDRGGAELALPDAAAAEVAKVAPKKRATGRQRKTNPAIEEEIACSNAELVRPVDASQDLVEVAPKKRGRDRKRKARDEDPVLEQIVNVAVDEEGDELAASVAARRSDEGVIHKNVRSQKPASRDMHMANEKNERPANRSRQKVVEAARRTASSAVPPSDAASDVDSKHTRRPASSRRTKTTLTQRQPLAETNMNITMRSASPEKLPQDAPKESTFQEPKPKELASAPAQNQIHLPDARSPTKSGSKRRKFDIKRDAVATTNQCSEPTANIKSQTEDLSEIKNSKQSSLDQAPWAAKTVASAADQGRGAATLGQRRRNLIREAKEDAVAETVSPCETLNAPVGDGPNVRDITQGATIDQCAADAGDEDVDWLFAPQPQANAPKLTISKLKKGSGMKSRKFKMPEIDLDDLLSNIATFAQEKTKPGALVSQNVRLFASGERKSRGGTRKRAKG